MSLPAPAGEQVSWLVDTLREMADELEEMPSAPRPVKGPRPLLFGRIQLFRGGQAEWLRDLVRDEQRVMVADLAAARANGKPETHRDIVKLRQELRWSIELLASTERAIVELAGPDEDPR